MTYNKRPSNESSSTASRSGLSRSLALKLSKDIKDSALLSSIQLFEDQRTTTPPSSSSPSASNANNIANVSNTPYNTTTTTPNNNTNNTHEFMSSTTSNRNNTSQSKSLFVSANSKSLSSLLFINTTGNFSYDGTSYSVATTPTVPNDPNEPSKYSSRANKTSSRQTRNKLARSDSITELENRDDEEDILHSSER